MKVLITGSKGFVGSHLRQFLNKNNIKVVSYDLLDGQDILDKKTLEKEVRKTDYIIHLAAIGDVYQAEKNPQNALKVGVLGTQNLIEVANKYSIKKIIYASTWEVYGKPAYQPIDENHPCNPIHPYAITKLGGELIIRSAFNKTPWIILRLGTIYGKKMRPYGVIPLFIKNAFEKKTIYLHNEGKQTRQFIHINDACKSFLLALKNDGINNEIFNIVSDEVITIKKLADLITKKLPTKIKKAEKRQGDPISSIISSEKAKKILNWENEVKLEVGILNLIKEIKRTIRN